MYFTIVLKIVFILIILLPVLLMVAFFTLLERVGLAHIHRRSGRNLVGFQGLGQAIADAIKLISKEYFQRIQSTSILFNLSPVFTFIISLSN
jgi:NADH:ubiquinone oxidoreductase subunit H